MRGRVHQGMKLEFKAKVSTAERPAPSWHIFLRLCQPFFLFYPLPTMSPVHGCRLSKFPPKQHLDPFAVSGAQCLHPAFRHSRSENRKRLKQITVSVIILNYFMCYVLKRKKNFTVPIENSENHSLLIPSLKKILTTLIINLNYKIVLKF